MAGSAFGFEPVDTRKFVAGIDDGDIQFFAKALQERASKNGGVRAAGTPGYKASVEYVRGVLNWIGYDTKIQQFEIALFKENADPVLARVSPSPKTFDPATDISTLEYSGKGDVSGLLQIAGGTIVPPPATPSSTSGCAPGDFPAATRGRIALIQRGTCPFLDKVRNAETAGAIAAIVFNEGQAGRTEVVAGTLGEAVGIPAVGVSYATGKELYDLTRAGAVRMRVAVDSQVDKIVTFNVLADLPGKVKDRTVVVGAHLDSVAEGPGINDNGSGTATLLAIAQELKRQKVRPQNTIRFAFWGAEESGLLGSNYYVGALSDAEKAKIALNLNFDMLGSPNYVRFVYDGDGNAFGDAGPTGSDVIEKVFQDFLKSSKLASAPTEFDGRSDYFAFIEAGIPAGGLFSGAEGVKTVKEAKAFGGEAGKPYDSCYHQACDDIKNLNATSLRDLGKAAAHAVFTFAQTKEDVRLSSPQAATLAKKRLAASTALYRGPKLVR